MGVFYFFMDFEDIHAPRGGNPTHSEASVGALIRGLLHGSESARPPEHPDKMRDLAHKLLRALDLHVGEWGDN